MDAQLIKTIKNGTVEDLKIHRYRCLEINNMELYQILTDEIIIKQTTITIGSRIVGALGYIGTGIGVWLGFKN